MGGWGQKVVPMCRREGVWSEGLRPPVTSDGHPGLSQAGGAEG